MIGVVCGREIEAISLRHHLDKLEKTVRRGRPFFVGDFSFEQVAIVVTEPGKTMVAAGTQLLIDLYQPRLVVSYGCAGAIDPHRKIGDVIIAGEAIEHDVDAFTGDVKRCGADPERSKNLWQALRDDAGLSSHVVQGIVISGDGDIRSHERKGRLWERFKAQSVDWESSSVARVAKLCSVPWLSVRIISDLAEEDMPKEFSENVGRVLEELAPRFLGALAETGGV